MSTVPSTSLAAYRSVQNGMIGDHHKNIIAALRVIKSGMYEDIAVYTGMEKHQVGRRLSELERMEIIYNTKEKRITSTGRQAYVYKLIPTEPTQINLFDNN